MKIKLKEYKPHLGFGVYTACSDDDCHFLIDMHSDGTTEPFLSFAYDTETSMEDIEIKCKNLEGKEFEVEDIKPWFWYASNGKML